MKVFQNISSVVVGIVFLLSGFLKALDPVGTGLKVAEYLGLSYSGLSVALGVALSSLEFLTGVALLMRLKIKLFSFVALIFSVAFLIVTFISAEFGWVKDCGCFGEAFYIAPWPTFLKNVVLTLLAIVASTHTYTPFFSSAKQWCCLMAGAMLIAGFSLYSYYRLPLIDFTQFKPDTYLLQSNLEASKVKYKTTLLYSKGSKIEKFDLKNLPDSTWRFVDSQTEVIEGSERAASMQFTLKDSCGNYVTDSILSRPTRKMFISIYKPLTAGQVKRLQNMVASATEDTECYILSALAPLESEAILKELSQEKALSVLYADFKTVITLNRSNGGFTYLQGDRVVRKSN